MTAHDEAPAVPDWLRGASVPEVLTMWATLEGNPLLAEAALLLAREPECTHVALLLWCIPLDADAMPDAEDVALRLLRALHRGGGEA